MVGKVESKFCTKILNRHVSKDKAVREEHVPNKMKVLIILHIAAMEPLDLIGRLLIKLK